MIHVIARITTLPGKRPEVLAAFHDNMPAVHAEKGCVEYQPVVDFPDAGPIQTEMGTDTFVVVEKWETIEDLRAHAQSAHMAAYAKKTASMIADRAVHVLTEA